MIVSRHGKTHPGYVPPSEVICTACSCWISEVTAQDVCLPDGFKESTSRRMRYIKCPDCNQWTEVEGKI